MTPRQRTATLAFAVLFGAASAVELGFALAGQWISIGDYAAPIAITAFLCALMATMAGDD